MPNNNRIYYAVQQVGFKKDAETVDNNYTVVHGLQSVGMTTNFNLEQVFELGQQAIFENIEEIPDVEITLNKVMDGYPPLFQLATMDAATTNPTLVGRSNTKTFVSIGIFEDDDESCGSDNAIALSMVECSGMYVSSVGFNFPLDDSFNEDLTVVGNSKIWMKDPRIVNPAVTGNPGSETIEFSGGFASNDDTPQAIVGVGRRQDMIFGTSASGTDTAGGLNDPDITVLPREVFGLTNSGTNELISDVYGAHVSNITVSADLGREVINELGRKAPFHRFVTFPVEITCEIEVTSISGDMVSVTEGGIYTTDPTDNCADLGNLQDRTIRIATCEGIRLYLGKKNKLSSINYGGGDTGGGNVAVSYTFTTFNDFTVMHSGDPHSSGPAWWTARATYLAD